MATQVELIYCADGNKRFAEIAIEAGFTYGAQLPKTVYFHPEFVDQDWKKPNREKYMQAIEKYKPRIASVLDWEYPEQLSEVLSWAEDVAQFVETVVIIPKVRGGIEILPRIIGGKPVRLGYSVPTSYGRTVVHLSEFLGWPIHLLGGSPRKQLELAGVNRLAFGNSIPKLNIVSADCNYHLGRATRNNQFYCPDGSARYAKNRFWPTLKESGGGVKWGDGSDTADAPYEAFRRSCENIMQMWGRN